MSYEQLLELMFHLQEKHTPEEIRDRLELSEEEYRAFLHDDPPTNTRACNQLWWLRLSGW